MKIKKLAHNFIKQNSLIGIFSADRETTIFVDIDLVCEYLESFYNYAKTQSKGK